MTGAGTGLSTIHADARAAAVFLESTAQTITVFNTFPKADYHFIVARECYISG